MNYDGTVAPDQQLAVFPNQISDPSLFSASDISLVAPNFRFPYILQSSLQIEREFAKDTVITVGTSWTHGVHLISSSAYDLNMNQPVGTTTYILCPSGAATPGDCAGGRTVTLPNLDAGLLTEGRITPNFGQINATIAPGINNYNSFFVQGQRRFHHGLAFQTAYTFSKNMMSRGVDFNNQFDFSNTHAPYLLDQRHRLSIAAVYSPEFGEHLQSATLRGILSSWTASTVMQFASGRPYAALLDNTCASDDISQGCPDDAVAGTVNNTAANQSTANSALGINAGSPSPFVGLDSFYGPWTKQVDLGLARRFRLTESQAVTFEAQAFNLFNHPNYYVQNGNGVNPTQYEPFGSTCGDGQSQDQTCYLAPNTGQFGTLNIINSLNGPRVLQFALKYTF